MLPALFQTVLSFMKQKTRSHPFPAVRILFCILAFCAALCLLSCGGVKSGFSDPDEAARIRESMKYVIHAAGRLEGTDSEGNLRGYDGSNSMEGLDRCAEAHAKVIELDFNFTSDGQLACIHDWYPEYADGIVMNTAPTLEEFLKLRIFGNFTPIWIEDVKTYLAEHPDVYIVTDIKDDNIAGCRAIAEACPDLKNRFLVQIYDKSEYDAVRELGFEYVIFTLYRLTWNEKTDWADLGRFAKEHPLIGFTFSYELCTVPDYVAGMKKSGVPLYIHTVNEGEDAYFEEGIAGVYTDLVR